MLMALCCVVQVNAQKKIKVKKSKTKKVFVVKTIDTSNIDGFTAIKLPSGIIYRKAVNGNGAYTAKVGDNALIHIRSYISDSMLFDSYKLNNNEPVPATINAPTFNGDVMELLLLAKDGDSIVARVQQDSLFRGDTKPPFVRKGDTVKYQIKVLEITDMVLYKKKQKEKANEQQLLEDPIIEKYLAEQKITDAKKTKLGSYYTYTKKGKGRTPNTGELVSMNYTGYFMNGTKFDSNETADFNHKEPYRFKVGRKQVIEAWDEAVSAMHIGDRIKLIIPSPLAYGANDRPGIPANSILVFEMELIDIPGSYR